MVERMTERKLTNLVQCKYNLHDLRSGVPMAVFKKCSARLSVAGFVLGVEMSERGAGELRP